MQYLEPWLHCTFLATASNDNEDLLAFPSPDIDLSIIRGIKRDMVSENAENGVLLSSRRQRRFFQEVLDAERYILWRYFSKKPPEEKLRSLKRRILDLYLTPKLRRRRSAKKS